MSWSVRTETSDRKLPKAAPLLEEHFEGSALAAK
jgi:hypothetical protein